MFGYVFPCQPELKIKDYEKFKGYYCGLCYSIKKNYGNIPRVTLNYDMTFLAVLLDSINKTNLKAKRAHCIVHPIKKRLFIIDNEAIDYAAFCNVALAYFKMTDDVRDDNSITSKFSAFFLKAYLKKFPEKLKKETEYIKDKLNELYLLEASKNKNLSLDMISHPFAELTGFIIASYCEDAFYKDNLYWLGYNLGKWIYLMDAFDDLEEDMKKLKFNAINSVFNQEKKPFKALKEDISSRIEFTVTSSAASCFDYLEKLNIEKNKDLLYNIIQFGLMEKMDKIFKGSDTENEKSL